MVKAIVVMLCGPHDNRDREDGFSFRRINHAIEVALSQKLPLAIAGDAFNGADLRVCEDEAVRQGVKTCIRLYDARANTLADVQAVVNLLKTDARFSGVTHVHLVTDVWHMDRAATMLMGELLKEKFALVIECEDVYNSPTPPQKVIDGEKQGTRDYLAGKYGNAIIPPYGKSQVVEVEADEDPEPSPVPA